MSHHTELNRKAFDDFAATYNAEPWQKRLTAQVTEGLQQRKDWLGARWVKDGKNEEVRLLDYACGTGAASLALQPFVTKIVGMDLSEGMVTKYNEAFAKLGLSQSEAHAVVGDLTSDDSHDLQSGSFDVAVVSAALHHVSDPELLMKRLTQLLKPDTGVLIIVDFLPFEHRHLGDHDRRHEHMAKTIKKHGFNKEDMAALYQQAGLQDFGFDVLKESAKLFDDPAKQQERAIFIARGRR